MPQYVQNNHFQICYAYQNEYLKTQQQTVALVAASESEDFVRVDIGSDEDDWSCIPEDLVKATLDKTLSRLPGSRTSRRALNVLLVGGLSIVFVYLTQLKRRNIEVHDVNAPSSVVTGSSLGINPLCTCQTGFINNCNSF